MAPSILQPLLRPVANALQKTYQKYTNTDAKQPFPGQMKLVRSLSGTSYPALVRNWWPANLPGIDMPFPPKRIFSLPGRKTSPDPSEFPDWWQMLLVRLSCFPGACIFRTCPCLSGFAGCPVFPDKYNPRVYLEVLLRKINFHCLVWARGPRSQRQS